MTRIKVFDAPFTGSRLDGLTRKRMVNGVLTNYTVCEYDGSRNTSGQLIDLSGNNYHLTKSGTFDPYYNDTGLQLNNGNNHRGLVLGGAAYPNESKYQVALDATLQAVWTSDFTVTLMCSPSTLTACSLFATYRWTGVRNGIMCSQAGIYFGDGATTTMRSLLLPSNHVVNTVNILQIRVISNLASMWLNGTPSAENGKDMTGYRTNGLNMTIGSDTNGSYLQGPLLYFRLDREGLSDIEITKDRAALLGYGGFIDGRLQPSTITRSGTKLAEKSDKKIFIMPGGVVQPSNGGLLCEGARSGLGTTRTNHLLYSSALNQWSKVGSPTVNTTALLAPDNTLTGNLVTATSNTDYYYQGTTAHPSGVSIAPSFWIKRISTTSTLVVENSRGTAYGRWEIPMANLPDEWIRITPQNLAHYNGSIINAWVATTTFGGFALYCKEAATIQFYVWGCQLENEQASTTYIPTTTAATSLGADTVLFNWPIDKIPGIGYGYQYTKFQVELEVKKPFITRALNAANAYPFILSASTTNKSLRMYIPVAGGTRSFVCEFRDTPNTAVVFYGQNNLEWNDSSWHKLSWYFDFITPANSYVKIDDIIGLDISGFSTPNRFLTFDAGSRIGIGTFLGSSPSNCYVRNVKIWLDN